MIKHFFTGAFLLLFLINKVQSQLTVENQTNEKIFFALGYSKASGPFDLFAKGWWSVEARQSIDITSFRSFAAGRDIYIHAFDNKGNKWGNKYDFWVSSEKFDELEKCCTKDGPRVRLEKFSKINTEESSIIKVIIAPDGKIKKKVYCNSLAQFTNLTAPLVEKFLNIAVPAFIVRQTDIDCGNNAKLQFEVHRNGRIYVTTGITTSSFGTIKIHVPIRIIDARIDWFETDFGITVRHHEDIEGTELTIHSSIDYEINSNGGISTTLTNSFTWDNAPYFDVFGIKISIGDLCEPHVNKIMQGMNGQWYTGTQPLIQSFVNGNCKWIKGNRHE